MKHLSNTVTSKGYYFSSIAIYFFLVLFSCTNEQKAKLTTNNIYNLKLKQADSLDGYWMSDELLERIEKSRYLYGNDNQKTLFYAFKLKKDILMSDTAFLFAHDTHEGGFGNYLKFDSLSKFFINYLSKNPQNLSKEGKIPYYLKPKTKDYLEIHFINSKKIETYRRIKDVETEIRKLLFEGKYMNLSDSSYVNLSKDGQILGLNSNNYFEPQIDFHGGPPLFDNVRTQVSKDKCQNILTYKFIFSKDTIILFKETSFDTLTYESNFNEPPIKLIRVGNKPTF